MPTSHRTMRANPLRVATDPEERERYLNWVNMPETRRYIQMVHDRNISGRVDPNNPLAPQVAIATVAKQDGAIGALNLLINLDDPDEHNMETDTELVPNWGVTEEEPTKE